MSVRQPKFSRMFYLYSDGVHIEKLLFKTILWFKPKILSTLKEQEKFAKFFHFGDRGHRRNQEGVYFKAKGGGL